MPFLSTLQVKGIGVDVVDRGQRCRGRLAIGILSRQSSLTALHDDSGVASLQRDGQSLFDVLDNLCWALLGLLCLHEEMANTLEEVLRHRSKGTIGLDS